MAEGRGPLRRAIDDWLETGPVGSWIIPRWKLLVERNDAVADLFVEAFDQIGIWALIYLVPWAFGGLVYVITGNEKWLTQLRFAAGGVTVERAIAEYTKFWRDALRPTEDPGAIEALGTIIAEPILTAIGSLSEQEGEAPENYVRRVYGVLTAAVLAPGIVANAAEAAGLGQIETPASLLGTLMEVLGLSAIGGGAAAPISESGIIPAMRRAFRSRYRPARFTVSDLRDLYALGEITRSEMVQEARFEGWRERDIDKWINLAFRTIPQGDIWDLYHGGHISQEETVRRLRALGFEPEDIPLLFLINQKEDVDEAKATSVTVVKKAFREGLASEAELRELLAAADRSEREIDLIIKIEKARQEQELRALTVGQIRDAWEENVLTDAEVTYWLGVNGFGDEEVGVLLRTWKARIDPEFRRLNKGTIIGAYVQGILNRSQAANKLEGVGFAGVDARLELDLAEARNPEVFGAAPPKPPRVLAPGTLDRLLAAGLITRDQMRQRLIDQDYSEEDAELLTMAAEQRAVDEPRPLNQSSVEEAYLFGVLSRAQAIARLRELDFTPEDAEVVLQTLEAANPAVFAPESVQSLRVPSAGALVEALRSRILTEAEFYDRMREIGFDRAGADIYFQLAIRAEPKRAKLLTPVQVADAFERGMIPYGEALARLMEQGYTNVDALLFLRLRVNVITEQEPWKLLVSGLIRPEAAFEQLFAMGFTEAEIDEAIAGVG